MIGALLTCSLRVGSMKTVQILRTTCPIYSGYSYRRGLANRARNKESDALTYVWVLSAVYVVVATALYARDRIRKKKRPILQTLSDPHMKGKDAEAFLYKGYWLPLTMVGGEQSMKQIQDFKLTDQDIMVASFPKSGTTWVQEIIYNILHAEPCNVTIEERFPYLEFIYPGLQELSRRSPPRLIKSHLPYSLLPEDAKKGRSKIVYIARNPKDVVVSYFHFVKMLKPADYQGTIQDFAYSFLEGNVNYGPWEKHVEEFWTAQKEKSNILFITYEDLHMDAAGCVRRLATFLGVELSSERVADICARCSFGAMKHNDSTNYSWWDEAGIRNTHSTQFMRKGKVGDWENYLSKDLSKQMDQKYNQIFSSLGLTFKDKL